MRCSGLGGCAGAAIGTIYAGNCYPFDIWSITNAGSGSYVWGYLQGSAFGINTLPGTLAFSVRCFGSTPSTAIGGFSYVTQARVFLDLTHFQAYNFGFRNG